MAGEKIEGSADGEEPKDFVAPESEETIQESVPEEGRRAFIERINSKRASGEDISTEEMDRYIESVDSLVTDMRREGVDNETKQETISDKERSDDAARVRVLLGEWESDFRNIRPGQQIIIPGELRYYCEKYNYPDSNFSGSPQGEYDPKNYYRLEDTILGPSEK